MLLLSALSPCGGWRSKQLFLLCTQFKIFPKMLARTRSFMSSPDRSFSLNFALNDESENRISGSSDNVLNKLKFSLFYTGKLFLSFVETDQRNTFSFVIFIVIITQDMRISDASDPSCSEAAQMSRRTGKTQHLNIRRRILQDDVFISKEFSHRSECPSRLLNSRNKFSSRVTLFVLRNI